MGREEGRRGAYDDIEQDEYHHDDFPTRDIKFINEICEPSHKQIIKQR